MAPSTRRHDVLSNGTSTRSSRSSRNDIQENTNKQNIGLKRARDSMEKEGTNDPPLKKARYAVEILSKQPQAPPVSRPQGTKKSMQQRSPPPPPQQPTIVVPSPPRKTPNHHEKVVNGIKHELDRLEPAAADLKKVDEKRSLRSAEGSRFKSELSLYFPEYDEMIGNEPKEERMYHFCEHD